MLHNNKGQELVKGYSLKQEKSYKTCLQSFKGLTHKEAERILFDLLSEIKHRAIVA